jgi:hypothetical protein
MKRRKIRKQDHNEKSRKEASRLLTEKLDGKDGGITRFHQVEKIQCANSADK